MGFFSWRTSDTDESIPNVYSGKPTFAVKMMDDRGNVWVEREYEGYGNFGGKDYFALLDEMNGGDGDRTRGIDLYYSENENVKFPVLVTLECTTPFTELPRPKDCEFQGYFYLFIAR